MCRIKAERGCVGGLTFVYLSGESNGFSRHWRAVFGLFWGQICVRAKVRIRDIGKWQGYGQKCVLDEVEKGCADGLNLYFVGRE